MSNLTPLVPAEAHFSRSLNTPKSDPELERYPAQNSGLEWWLNFAPRPLWVKADVTAAHSASPDETTGDASGDEATLRPFSLCRSA